MKHKQSAPKKAKISDAERHKRFVEVARELGSDESAEGFDRALKRIARAKK